jgi:hypothetical protein
MIARLLTTALAAASALGLGVAPALAQEPAAPDWRSAPRDWSETLRQDAAGLHAIIVDSHPGIHDERNPAFRSKVDEGLALALERARTTTDAGGWWWAMRGFVASFDDGHMQIGLKGSGSFPTRWPGFLTVYRGADQVVANRDETDANAPPMGAKLIDCDGVSAERLAAERIGAFRGRWFLEAQHVQFGDWLFMNASNPWIGEMRECRFEAGGQTKSWTLNWRGIETVDLAARRNGLAQRGGGRFGMTTLDDGAMWLSMPSFNGDPGSESHTQLTAILAGMTEKQSALRAAPYVVLDLRGNGGGSSHWSERMAVLLWGIDWVRAHNLPPIEAIEWRASDANLAAIQSYFDEWTASNEDAERINWARDIIDGMTAARAEGKPYFRDAAGPRSPVADGPPPAQLVHGPVYVLTDAGCGSACLDAVDLWKSAGAIQIGRETSADTVYMDVRGDELPSGLAELAIPMKVWRGRQRGNNEPQRPAHIYEGDMSDDAALAVWVRSLG